MKYIATWVCDKQVAPRDWLRQTAGAAPCKGGTGYTQ